MESNCMVLVVIWRLRNLKLLFFFIETTYRLIHSLSLQTKRRLSHADSDLYVLKWLIKSHFV